MNYELSNHFPLGIREPARHAAMPLLYATVAVPEVRGQGQGFVEVVEFGVFG